ncbi:T9SS type B sorting domain-containing protein [Flavobacterium silvaticum]|uniref:Gliding motility-associated C-terminal domain-containing protein n=1 Tax=Flavobacterium silvaticum TaxID=1852020 RepID=A0A972FVU4_9FLAO|nr:gliding motility-associated C-terminal domain-containing protein [Flavobacterium silvaticum]NMH29648.1 gliding motility-associated C-terminal domain-containing protein [Flavobacterium silvaticum]
MKTKITGLQSLLFVFMFFSLSVKAQLPAFTFTATHTNETCSGNACVNFTVSGTVTGATVLYSVYELPDLSNPLTTTSSASFCGLEAGSYTVFATQSLNGQSSTQQVDFEVENQIELLSYSLTNRSDGCGETGTIIVHALTGNPEFYEIISGPQILPQQASNELSGLTGGTYTVRVTDVCGEAVVQTYTFFPQPSSFSLLVTPEVESVDCDTSTINQSIAANSNLNYPIDIEYTITLPNGTVVQNSISDAQQDMFSLVLSENVLLDVGQTYSYTISASDSCGHTFSQTFSVTISGTTALIAPDISCEGTTASVLMALQAIVTEAPDAYDHDLPYALSEFPSHTFYMGMLPYGQYTVMAQNECGIWQELHLDVGPINSAPPVYSVQRGCGPGYASLFVGGTSGIIHIELASGPAEYASDYPIDMTALLNNETLRVAGLVTGSYMFHVTDLCESEFDLPITIEGLTVSDNSSVIPHCGSFDINLQYSDNNTSPITFWLQRYDAVTQEWGHPASGAAYVPGTAITAATGFQLTNTSINYNLVFPSGHFRVVSYRVMFSTDPVERNCLNTIFEFDFFGVPDIRNVYSFSCSSNLNDVIVEAVGMEPLTYRITSFDGSPMLVDNGNSGYFTGLAPGIYNFQVEDVCHNIVNQLYDISDPYPLTIGGEGLCENQMAQITVPSFSFLNYSWHKEGSGQELSNTATLEFPSYSADNLGTYYVHITASAPNSCLDITLEYTFEHITLVPFAGGDTEQSFCDAPDSIDLNSYLSGDFQNGGNWSAITPNITLDDNVWNSGTAATGNYTFRYSVSNDCGPTDEADIIIHILPAPPVPQLVASIQTCENGNIELNVAAIPGATYEWNGPLGFTSSEQNPTIENATVANSGIYSVQAFIGACPSEIATVNANVAALPELSISFGCRQDRMILDVESASADAMEFHWIGPDGFSANGESIDITGNLPGDYTVTGTNPQGCSTEATQHIATTLCRISAGISPNDDGDNDNFDLSGFGEIERVKIFNRYGMTVYEQAQYVDQWHGQDYNGNLLPSATYFYLITLASGEPKTGWVYLLHP